MGSLENEAVNPEAKRSILWSILLHGLLILLVWKISEKSPSDLLRWEQPTSMPTRVVSEAELQRTVRSFQTQSLNRPIVESEVPPKKKLELIEKQSRFRGERTQRVEKETVAPGFGSATGSASRKKSHVPPSLKDLGVSNGLPIMDVSKPEEPTDTRLASNDTGMLVRGHFDALPKDIAFGARTLLNTDEFVQASFFNRLRREVAPRWEPMVQSLFRRPDRVRPNQYVTVIEFWMNSGGIVTRSEVQSSSTNSSLDEVARQSLLSIPPMHNLPSVLRQSDGTYHLNLTFIVNLEQGGVQMNYAADPRL